MRSTRPARRATAVVATLAGALVTVVPTEVARASTECGVRITTAPLVAFGDANSYFPLEGGTFESGDLSTFDLAGTPSIVQENEPWQVLDHADARSLALPPGAVLKATVCVQWGEDSMRFFAKSPGLSGSSLTVRTTVATTYGSSVTTSTMIGGSQGGWTLGPRIPLLNLLAIDGRQYVTVSFKNTGTGTWQLDDLLVDPWRTL